MTIQPQTDIQRIEFGRRLRQLRNERGWTLSQVAEKSGLAISTISKVERGVMSLTYDRLALLANGLGVDMATFFSEHGKIYEPGSFAIARKGEFQRQETKNYVYEMLFPDIWHKAMTPMMGTLKAHNVLDFDEFVSHPGQEFLLVLEGSITVHLQGHEDVKLDAGDSLYFDSSRGHLYASTGAKDARILVVCTDIENPPMEKEK
ncbi:helix-turn-helix domain-containing protein [Sneathiella glossodoripedis]|uniref:helix-turn-helix domain-containing protein n=1 Tax=Sneathiella glossodoripedis TaxID=418853 RepID=UPI00046F273D|nr:XRE family transcriptional regulator [Sneathiella glossodoripedis]